MTHKEFEYMSTQVRPQMMALARRFNSVTGRCYDCEDIVQEALLTLWELAGSGYRISNPIEVCRNLEMCRKDILALNAVSTLPFDPKDVVSSIEDAIVDFAIILGNNQPEAIHSILDEIGFTGVRSFDEEF